MMNGPHVHRVRLAVRQPFDVNNYSIVRIYHIKFHTIYQCLTLSMVPVPQAFVHPHILFQM